ncbi:MAG: hypothetical protein ACFFG0_24225, partial [Candidatus Thorarchaeota archaeon]
LLSSFYLYNEVPREDEHLELLEKSFINTVIDKKGISFQKLVENTNYFQINIKNIKVELFRNAMKYYSIQFPIVINTILLKINKKHSLNSLPFLFDPEIIHINNLQQIVREYPEILQFVKYSKENNKMKVKITEEIFSDDLMIKLK